MVVWPGAFATERPPPLPLERLSRPTYIWVKWKVIGHPYPFAKCMSLYSDRPNSQCCTTTLLAESVGAISVPLLMAFPILHPLPFPPPPLHLQLSALQHHPVHPTHGRIGRV